LKKNAPQKKAQQEKAPKKKKKVNDSPGELPPLDSLTDFEQDVVAVLLATVPGDVMSYGEVAAEAGRPGAARAVGGVLRRIEGLPWWRVVASNGRLIPHSPQRQAKLLNGEGVATKNGRVVIG